MNKFAISLSLLASLVIGDSAVALVIHVPTDQPTIQAGINGAGSTDTILVAPGVYVGLITVGIPLTILSEFGPEVTRLESSGDVILLNGIQSDTFHLVGFELVSSGGRGIASNFSVFEVDSCIFSHTHSAAIHFSGYSGTIRNCEFYEISSSHSSTSSVFVDNLGKTRLERNIFYGLSYDYAFFTTAERVDLVNNTVVGCDGGFNVENSYGSPGTVFNNILHDVSGIAIATNSAVGPVIDYNLYYANGSDVVGGSAGANSIFEDPVLADTASSNFTPQPGSPVIDAGHPDPSYNDPDGTRNDIGAISGSGGFPYLVNLRVVGEERFHVISNTPTFVWGYRDTLAAQVAFEIEVGSDNDWGTAEMWVSGTITSPDTSAIYAGTLLTDGATYFLRIRVFNGVDWGGWGTIHFRMNSAPSAPVAFSPGGGISVSFSLISLVADNSSDAESDPRTYDFEIYSDNPLTILAGSLMNVAQQPTQTQSGTIPGLVGGSAYWWRVRASDGFEYSGWSNVADFLSVPPLTRRVPSEYSTIQAAIDASAPGDTVLVAAGTYVENLNFGVFGLVLISESGWEHTVIRPEDAASDIIVIANNQLSEISGFTIRDVNNNNSVGIECDNCDLTIRDNLFTNNTEAAVWIRNGGSVVAERNQFIDNASSGDAAALLCRGFDRAIVRDNVFLDNTSNWYGGGLHFSNGNFADARYNLILRNRANDYGGGVAAFLVDTVSLINNTVDSNNAGIGGGMFLANIPLLTLQNNIITQNLGHGTHLGGTFGTINRDYNNTWLNSPGNLSGYMGLGGSELSVDPEYNSIDPTTFKHGIWISSPCLNSGNPSPEFNDSDGSRNDMGAFPFVLVLPLADELNLGTQVQFRVVDHTPRFYWSYVDTIGTPSGFEVEVGANSDWAVAEHWQSGPVLSTDTSVDYAGLPLVDGSVYFFRVRLFNGSNWGDWLAESFRMNTPPGAPAPVSPVDGDTLHYQIIRSIITNSIDAEGDSLDYEIELYHDEALETLADAQYLTPGPTETTSDTWTSLIPESPYWWRARAIDGYEYSEWSSARMFNARPPATIKVPGKAADILLALDIAGAHDTVRVAPGSYYGNLNFSNRPLRLLSDSGAAQTLLFPSTHSLPLIAFGSTPADSIEIAGFTFVGGEGGSVMSLNGGAPRIHHNIFRNFNGQPALSMVFHVVAGAPTITRNIFVNNLGISCIGIYGGHARVINNTFDRNRGGLHLIGGSAEILNNIVTGSTTFGLYGNLTNADYNCVYGNFPNHDQYAGGPNDIILSPVYYDAVGGDFRLQPGSPCINMGDPGAAYNDSDGSRNDMGAFAAVCECGCHADPICDHQTDILDVAFVIAGAFRGLSEIMDDFCFPHGTTVGGRTDMNCSGATDVVDVVRVIDVAFRGDPPASAFCTLCTAP